MTDLPNVFLLVLDTMRKDALGAYGGEARTPGLDSLLKDAVVFPNCVSPSPWTVPSHASIFTGLYPSRHGVHETRDRKLPDMFDLMAKSEAESLPEHLRERGYNTVALSANPSISPASGFDRGFNALTLLDASEPDEEERRAIEWASQFGKTRDEVRSRLLRGGRFGDLWRLYRVSKKAERAQRLRNYPMIKGGDRLAKMVADSSFEQPFFLFVNLFEMHEPYTSSEPTPLVDLFGGRVISPSEVATIKDRYREAAETLDRFLSGMISYLKESGTYDDCMVIITSDHGQAMKERGYYGHGTFVHPEIVEVPLFIKFPQNKKPSVEADTYQTLTGVPEVVKDSLLGLTSSAVNASAVISESFGIAHGLESVEGLPGFEEKRERFDRQRKAVYQSGYRLVVDGTAGEIQELECKGRSAEPRDHRDGVNEMLGRLRALRDEDFAVPENI